MANEEQDGDREEHSLGAIMDSLADSEHGDKMELNDVLRAFDERSSGVLITMLGLIAALPVIGAIPGISMAVSALLFVVLAQSVFGGGSLRLPGRLGRISISRENFLKGLDKGRGLTDRIDRVMRPRLPALTQSAASRLTMKCATAILALAMFPLAIVPWGVTPPAFGIVAFGLTMIARDGVFALVGYALSAVTALMFLWLL